VLKVPFLRRLSLQQRISLFVALGLLVGLSFFGLVGLQALEESTQRTLQERLTMARLVASHLDDILKHAIEELESIAGEDEIDVADGDMQPESDVLHDAYSELVIFTNSIFLLDSSGRVLLSEPYDEAVLGYDMSSYRSIALALEEGKSTISGLEEAPLSGAPVTIVSAPVRDAEGRIVAVLGGTIDLVQPNIGGFVQPLSLGKTGYTEIVDQNGIVIFRTEPGRPLNVVEKSDHPERFAALINEGKASVRTCHVCHGAEESPERTRDVLAFAPLSVASWGVAIRQSESEALSLTEELRTRLLLSGAMLLIGALIFVWLTVRDVVTPIHQLTAASKRIADGDLDGPVANIGQGEIGTLARSFDEMRLRLKDSLDEIERWNVELEQRVERRSKEIAHLFEVAKVLASTLELDILLNAIMGKVMDLLSPAGAAYLFLYDEELGKLVVTSSAGLDSELLSTLTFSPDEAIPGIVYNSCQPRLYASAQDVEDGMKEGAHQENNYLDRKLAALGRAQSALGVPLSSKEHKWGCLLLVGFKADEPFTEAHLPLAQALADQTAVAVENARLLKEAEEAHLLREADRVKSQFISTVSHELRTPLTSIKGYSTSLLREDVEWDQETRRGFLEIIDERADDLRKLIDNLLEMSRMEAGALRLEKQPVLLPRLVEKVVEGVALRGRRHEFVIDFPAQFPVIEADARHIEQVLQNLVENAIKYSPEGGEISITGRADKEDILISIRDQGIGIDVRHLEHVFERFYRIDSELTRNTVGSGLGLSIAKGLIEANGGRIWVESEPGKGSAFHFTLPLSRAAQETEEEERQVLQGSP
jgi:signal transduction histidine kinase